MKKIILTLLLAAFKMSLIAQITLTLDDMPKSGRVNLLIHDTLSTPDIGVAGSSAQTWDFTGLTPHYPQFASYSSTAPYHQYASVFPESNFYSYGPTFLYGDLYGGAPVNYTNFGYMFMSSDTAALSVVGYVSQYGIAHQTPNEKILSLPMTYNDAFHDTSHWELFFNVNPADVDTLYRSHSIKYVEADAFGQLTTDFGTFDVLRIKENIIKVDSVFGIISGMTVFSMEIIRDTINNFHFWTNDVRYPIAMVRTDAQYNIKHTELLEDTVFNYQITGTVYNTDGSSVISDGTVELIPKTPVDNLFGIQEIVQIDANGNFQFSNILEYGQFLILAVPDEAMYPDFLPTYYGDTIYWQGAETVQLQTDTNLNIHLQNNTAWLSYPGNGNSISGIVWQNIQGSKGPANSTPSRGIRVTLEKNPGGEVIRYDQTNEDGVYYFEDLPDFEYRMRVDIPGVHMDSTYYIDLTSENNQVMAGYDFVYDSTFIYIYDATGLNEMHVADNISYVLYPNPVTNVAYINFINMPENEANYDFQVFDLTGRMVKQQAGVAYGGFSFSRDNLVSGIYFYRLSLDETNVKTGKFVIN